MMKGLPVRIELFSVKSAALLALLALAACQSTPGSKVSVDYYEISGTNLASLDRDIRRKGPRLGTGRHAVAVAHIRIIPRLEYRRRNGSCNVMKSDVDVKARVTLPAFRDRATASKELAKAWDNLDRYTRAHEATHVNIAFSHAEKMEKAFASQPPAKTCAEARSQSARIYERMLKDHDREQRQFDTDEERRISRLTRRSRG